MTISRIFFTIHTMNLKFSSDDVRKTAFFDYAQELLQNYKLHESNKTSLRAQEAFQLNKRHPQLRISYLGN